MRTVSLLGSTGSIGTQTLEVIADHRDEFTVQVLAAGGSNLDVLAEQAVEFEVQGIAIARGSVARLHGALDRANRAKGTNIRPEILIGPDATAEAAAVGADVVVNAIAGSIGLAPTLAALKAGSMLALANTESLVAGGTLVTGAASPAQIVPINAEHSAMAQALRAGRREDVARLILTASGGPFRGKTRKQLRAVTPAQARAHPSRTMGPIVATNSATLVNKGLELIAAHHLFDMPIENIVVVVHPESVVESMVEFVDGATIAHAACADMLLPIAHALAWPDRVAGAVAPIGWDQAATWTFEPVDSATFFAVDLCRAAARESGTHPAVLNAANEECAAAFLEGVLPFLGVVDTIARVLDAHEGTPTAELTLEAVTEAETWARDRAQAIIRRRA